MPSLPAIAFIGAGNMGSAIIAGLCSRQQKTDILVCDGVDTIRERHSANGLRVTTHISDVASSPIIVLAVKPQGAAEALAALKPHIGPNHLVISILAGTTTANLEAGLTPGVRVIRSMPNTPMAIGQGMVAICAGAAATDEDMDLAETIFASAAAVLRTTEDKMDAITAVSGSGPAYLFRFAEAQVAAALELGFTESEAQLLVGQTLAGSIAYLRSQDGFPAAELRQQVTSPGGTTAAALACLDAANFGQLIASALTAARDRSIELAAQA
ncbi:MAG: pyrroline-5-carboxylate reductase [Planctomycetota bacterium]|jgi:pyrroline-5-carboxylate reductase|nr:pyrroline-5-carboxylate reductase [Planctomycetota bacterium]